MKKTWIVAATMVVVVALSTAIVILYQQKSRADVLDAARSAALGAAKDRLTQLLSYDYHTLDHDLEAARSDTTGAFHDEFSDLTRRVVAPAARDQQIVTKTTVAGSSVVSAQPEQVVLLMFLDQVTQTKSDPASRVDGARVRVTLRQVDGQWLVAELTPL